MLLKNTNCLFTHKHKDNANLKNGTGKILSISGYTSALMLLAIALMMAYESVERLLNPQSVMFTEAIVVAVIGLIVNIVSAAFLHHDKEHSDHNIRAAYMHVLADALTSLIAIFALTAGMLWNIQYLDAVSGIIGSAVIIKWAYGLLFNSGKELVDYEAEQV
jgi:cation diffusion facilitator family transporter